MKLLRLLPFTIPTVLLISCSVNALADKLSSPTATLVSEMNHNPSIKNVKLVARDESQRRTTGHIQKNRDRALGFADVFVWLENTEAATVELQLQRIEIQDALTGTIQMATPTNQDILLKPLEQGEYAFHLTNKTGYSSQTKVKAVVTYNVQGETRAIASHPVEVVRY